MSSDFYVDRKDSKQPNFVLQTKYTTDLEDIRTIEKLELERRYWESTKIPWYILTEKDIPTTVLHNIKWLYPAMRESELLSNLVYGIQAAFSVDCSSSCLPFLKMTLLTTKVNKLNP